MLLIKLPKNRMNYLIEQMQTHFQADVLENGWEVYHKGRVHHLDLPGGLELIADVVESAIYRVSLNLEHFTESSCECGENDYCRHMAAVFFAAYAAHGRPELLLMQLRSAMAARSRMQKAAVQKQDRAKEKPVQAGENDLPKEWHRFFDQRFYGYTLSQQHSIELFFSVAVETLLPFADKWNPVLRDLYELQVYLFVMRKIESFYDHNQSSYVSFHFEQSCRDVVNDCWNRLKELTHKMDAKALRENYPGHWNETVSMSLERIGQPRTQPVNWLSVYRFLWQRLFRRAQDWTAELKRLELRLTGLETPSRRRDQYLLARAHFDIMQGNDTAAMDRLEQLYARQLSDFYDVLELLTEEQEWDRLQHWLRWLLPVLAKARQDEFQTVSGYWEEAVRHLNNDEEWVTAMRIMLPRSYYQYSAYLLSTKRYKQWTDLQLSCGVTLASLSPDDLRQVEASEPSLLLPLYHQAVERSILEKNRTSYTNAVRYIKKLQLLYRKLGQTELWTLYMQRLMQKYARLRAFQEELKKGKWAP